MDLASSTTTTSDPDNIIVGSQEVITTSEAVAGTQTIARHAPLGRVTATGELIESLPAANDGSQNPVAIAVHDIGTPFGTAHHPVYVGGGFDIEKIAWNAAWTDAQKAGAFDSTPIFAMKSPQ